MTERAEEMACRICLRVLNSSGTPAVYLHPAGHGRGIDHEPDPVPSYQLDTVLRRCDFCGDPYPLWALYGGNLTAIAVGADTTLVNKYGESWAACVTCYAFIRDGKLDQLSRHAARALGIHNPDALQHVAEFHHRFLEELDPRRTVLITSTPWPATSVEPRAIPKVRDRLSQLYRNPDQLPQRFRSAAASIADGLDRAHLIWVDEDFTDLAFAASATVPELTVGHDLLPAENGLLIWSRPTGPSGAAGASWTRRSGGWDIALYRTIGGGLRELPLQRVRENLGWLLPMRITGVADRQLIGGATEATAALATTWLLIAQRLAEPKPSPTSRATRQAYARANRTVPDVTIMRIRPPADRVQSQATTPSTRQRRPQTERVWVTPHWRNVAYGPGRAFRRPHYIDSFLRGPADAPIKLSTTVRVLKRPAPRDDA